MELLFVGVFLLFYFCLQQNEQIPKRSEEVIRVKKKTHIVQKRSKKIKLLTGNIYGSTSGLKKLPQYCLEKEKALIKNVFDACLVF